LASAKISEKRGWSCSGTISDLLLRESSSSSPPINPRLLLVSLPPTCMRPSQSTGNGMLTELGPAARGSPALDRDWSVCLFRTRHSTTLRSWLLCKQQKGMMITFAGSVESAMFLGHFGAAGGPSHPSYS
jgi:hypothetical protein